jgi:Rhomboid family
MPRQPSKSECIHMLPLSDSVPARRFPIVNTAIIIANLAVWLLYELPNLNEAVADASFYPCTVDGSCEGPLPWAVSWLTSIFMHGSWSHILGNMLFLFVFGKNVEDAFRPRALPRLLSRRRLRGDDDADRGDAAGGHGRRRASAQPRRERRDRSRARRLPRPLSDVPDSRVDRHLPRADLGVVLSRASCSSTSSTKRTSAFSARARTAAA